MDSAAPANERLESCLATAISGDRMAIRGFYEAFLAGPLYAPERHQKVKLSDQPTYPNDIFGLLALKASERVIVPVFSNPQNIFSWCGQEFSWRELSGRDLARIMPDQWWICVNPGSDVEKELSPWEISELSSGQESIDGLVQELLEDQPHEPISLKEVREDEYLDLKTALIAFAKHHPLVLSMKLLREEFSALDQDAAVKLVLGVAISACSNEAHADLKNSLVAEAQRALIGAESVRVETNHAGALDFSAGLFRTYPSFYEQGGCPTSPREFPNKINRLIKKWLGF